MKLCYNIFHKFTCGYSSSVERDLPKVDRRVRLPLPAPFFRDSRNPHGCGSFLAFLDFMQVSGIFACLLRREEILGESQKIDAHGENLYYNTTMKNETLKTESVLPQLPEPLLTWYRANARDLPWRHTRDPYRIWVSEIMLQQTRVAAVLGYYDRFLTAFPTVEALALASEDRLMKCWEGLGYYSRARNLQKAAKLIVDECDGRFPETYEALLKLPGIGEYTAGAIASAAFGEPVPAVDGNVLRVVARIEDCHDDVTDPKVRKKFREQVGEILPQSPEDIRIFNQAMMELGATVCVPNGPPNCEICPAGEFCRGRQAGTAEKLPIKTPKKARRIEEKTVFLLIREGEAALRKRDNTGLLAGLWEFPNVDGVLEENVVYEQLQALGLTVRDWKKKLTAKHIFTHVEWHMTGYVLSVIGQGPEDFLWVSAEKLESLAVPSAFSKFYEEAKRYI